MVLICFQSMREIVVYEKYYQQNKKCSYDDVKSAVVNDKLACFIAFVHVLFVDEFKHSVIVQQ